MALPAAFVHSLFILPAGYNPLTICRATSWTWGLGRWRRAMALPSAVEVAVIPCSLPPIPLGLGCPEEEGRRGGDTGDYEVRRGKQMLSRALPPGGYRWVERAISTSSSCSGGCLHKKSGGGSREKPTDKGNAGSRPSNLLCDLVHSLTASVSPSEQ